MMVPVQIILERAAQVEDTVFEEVLQSGYNNG